MLGGGVTVLGVPGVSSLVGGSQLCGAVVGGAQLCGSLEGAVVGLFDGESEGSLVGDDEGDNEGPLLGLFDGDRLGTLVGCEMNDMDTQERSRLSAIDIVIHWYPRDTTTRMHLLSDQKYFLPLLTVIQLAYPLDWRRVIVSVSELVMKTVPLMILEEEAS